MTTGSLARRLDRLPPRSVTPRRTTPATDEQRAILIRWRAALAQAFPAGRRDYLGVAAVFDDCALLALDDRLRTGAPTDHDRAALAQMSAADAAIVGFDGAQYAQALARLFRAI